MSARLTLNHAQEAAAKHSGKCLSSEYKNSSTPMSWQCSKGHKWKTTYNAIQRGHWCSNCGGTGKLTIEKMQRAAKKHDGFCLSSKYINGTTPLLWECSKGHRWKTPYLGIINKGAWCPECGKDKLHDPRKYCIEDMHNHAIAKGGKCLSSVFKHVMHKLSWECSEGHQWMGRVNDVINSGSWCNVCCLKYRQAESRCRDIIERLTKLKFPATRSVLPDRYELDMYNASCNLAFEYDGEQHFKFVPQWHIDNDGFLKQQKRDRRKNRLCKKLGIRLERIHYSVAKNDENLEFFLREKLIKHQIPLV